MMRLLLLLLVLLLLLFKLFPLLLMILFKEFDELFLDDTFELNKLLNLFELVDEELTIGVDSITCTKFDGNTPILPLSLPRHQPKR